MKIESRYPQIVDLSTPTRCPVCSTEWTMQVIEKAPDSFSAAGCDMFTCGTCKRPFFRVGFSFQFISPDGKRVMLY